MQTAKHSALPRPTRITPGGEAARPAAFHLGISIVRDARPSSLLQRFITPDEVANMVAYLASPLAAATNGAAVRVDGGVVRSI
ncbi:SDR family oxidoreductase [Hymenobacter caeli]|uniref:NAD(P)-dependent dehydrogenase (Short-subunit alcohol dehydrogenase family) n=1 Tax=Hymenobacter caeli TaxID=2735894 RepID=A0ABX2FP98_9BACT|nr:SDR family oxidoreductase [Hymenobacter caeli]NRT19005.1 NAD(P)-dependent dehydrogenase (short-subunit alcohol dehydrogenase family) [Hymenobacter caeli]